jgi:hypothetical protein
MMIPGVALGYASTVYLRRSDPLSEQTQITATTNNGSWRLMLSMQLDFRKQDSGPQTRLMSFHILRRDVGPHIDRRISIYLPVTTITKRFRDLPRSARPIECTLIAHRRTACCKSRKESFCKLALLSAQNLSASQKMSMSSTVHPFRFCSSSHF